MTTVMESNKTPEQLFKEEHPEVEKFYLLRFVYDENGKTPEQLFKEEHPEVEKFYILAVTDKVSEEYGSQFYECHAERPTDEKADQTLDSILDTYAEDMYEDEELTMYVDILEVTVSDDERDEYVELYTKERTVNGKQVD